MSQQPDQDAADGEDSASDALEALLPEEAEEIALDEAIEEELETGVTGLVRHDKNGKPVINATGAFLEVLGGALPDPATSLMKVIKSVENQIRQAEPSITQGAFNNVRGSWFEWLLSIAAWNAHIEGNSPFIALPLVKASEFDCSRLYVPALQEMVEHLRDEVQKTGVELISSNPDMVILNHPEVEALVDLPRPIQTIDFQVVRSLRHAYKTFIGRCEFNQVAGYASTKTSLRPDRRLQMAHEGSLMKALYVHLQTRQWITNPAGIKYYGLSAKVTAADRAAMQTVATHSITTVASIPQRAVDELFEVGTMARATEVFGGILSTPDGEQDTTQSNS